MLMFLVIIRNDVIMWELMSPNRAASYTPNTHFVHAVCAFVYEACTKYKLPSIFSVFDGRIADNHLKKQ